MAQPGTVRTFDLWRSAAFGLVAATVIGALAVIVTPPRTPGAPPATVRDRQVRPVQGSFRQWFGAEHDDALWFKSDFSYPDSDHPAWRADQIHFRDNRIELEVRRKKTEGKNIAGAEYQRRGFYHFGRYEVVMQAAPGSGTVSALFTHTHSQFGDPHDEIDIEFLGKDLTQLHANYFTDGQQAGGIYIPLGFDASQGVHLYAFEWEPGEIRWYVDDRLAHTARAADFPIPQAPGRLMLHLWSGGRDQVNWHGKPTFKDGATARFYCVSYQATGDTAAQCSDTFDAAGRK